MYTPRVKGANSIVSRIDNVQGRREHKHDLNVHATQKNVSILFYDYTVTPVEAVVT